MPANRWIDTTQPQTLLIATFLLYISAAEELLLSRGLFNPWWLGIAALQVAAGFGIANEKKWGYGLGIVIALVPCLFLLGVLHVQFASLILDLMFEVALMALLLHPQSREYQRIWFK